jgi:hypothetical protein
MQEYLKSESVYKYNKSLIETKIKQAEEESSRAHRNHSHNRKRLKKKFQDSMLKKTIRKARKLSKSRSRSKNRSRTRSANSKGRQLRQTLLSTQKA